MEHGKILTIGLIISLIATLIVTTTVSALPYAATGVTLGTNTTKAITASTVTVDANGGMILDFNLVGQTQTQLWQGYYGHVDGNIVLENAYGDVMYDWNVSTVQGEIYATRLSTLPNWLGLIAGTVAECELLIGNNSTQTDSCTNTFTQTADINVGSNQLSTIPSVDINRGAVTPGTFIELLLDNNSTTDGSDLVFATKLVNNQTDFNGGVSDFQMIVPENAKGAQGATATTYYFYLELE